MYGRPLEESYVESGEVKGCGGVCRGVLDVWVVPLSVSLRISLEYGCVFPSNTFEGRPRVCPNAPVVVCCFVFPRGPSVRTLLL